MKQNMELLEDDLDLIRESRGESTNMQENKKDRSDHAETIRAKDAQGIQNQLFLDDDEQYNRQQGKSKKLSNRRNRNDRHRNTRDFFDEDDMDGFIDDDIGDQDDLIGRGRDSRSRSGFRSDEMMDDGESQPITQMQLANAVDIFGTDYLESMQHDDEEQADERDKRYREKGVGVDLGVNSDDEIVSEDEMEDDHIFEPSDDEDEDGEHARKSRYDKAEAARLRKEMRDLRRKKEQEKRNAARKARLRKAFEPIQLAENFCTDKDDKIRMKDVPERFFDWNIPFSDDKDEMEEEAMWIMTQIPEITAEFIAPVPPKPLKKDEMDDDDDDDDEEIKDPLERKQREILNSIIETLKFIHKDNLEPEFIKRYRADIVSSPAVRNNLYAIFDENIKYYNLTSSRDKVSSIIENIIAASSKEEQKTLEETSIEALKDELKSAQEKLDDALKKEEFAKKELKNLEDDAEDDDDDDEDDELFGNKDDEVRS